MISPSDEHAMELEEFKFLVYEKPLKEASFNIDKSGRDLISILPLEKTSRSPISEETLWIRDAKQQLPFGFFLLIIFFVP
jgi:hypothetical protein